MDFSDLYPVSYVYIYNHIYVYIYIQWYIYIYTHKVIKDKPPMANSTQTGVSSHQPEIFQELQSDGPHGRPHGDSLQDVARGLIPLAYGIYIYITIYYNIEYCVYGWTFLKVIFSIIDIRINTAPAGYQCTQPIDVRTLFTGRDESVEADAIRLVRQNPLGSRTLGIFMGKKMVRASPKVGI